MKQTIGILFLVIDVVAGEEEETGQTGSLVRHRVIGGCVAEPVSRVQRRKGGARSVQVLQENLGYFGVVVADGGVEWRRSVAVGNSHVGAGSKQSFDDRLSFRVDRPQKRGEPGVVLDTGGTGYFWRRKLWRKSFPVHLGSTRISACPIGHS